MGVRLNRRAYEHAQGYGDFESVHRCGMLSAESRAGQYKHQDIKDAAAHLHGMLEVLR
jgi:thioester reductase-like protein